MGRSPWQRYAVHTLPAGDDDVEVDCGLFCWGLIGCRSDVDNKPVGFRERQTQLFHEIDHPASLEAVKESVVGTKAATDFVMQAMNELIIKRQRLLHRTDHQELLKACRLIMQRHDDGVFSRAKIYFTPEELK